MGTGGADVVGTSVAEGAVRMSAAGTGAADAGGAGNGGAARDALNPEHEAASPQTLVEPLS